jgi:chromosome segregation ATPase
MDTPEVTDTPDNVTHLVRYQVTLDDIREMGAKYAALTCETPDAYEETRKAIAVLRSTRVAIEEKRVDLKRSALEYGRKVDGVAKELTAEIEALELPLKEKKAAVDEVKARAKREAEEAERAEIERTIREAREAEEARLKAERDAEALRLKAERDAEESRLAAIAKAQAIEAERIAEARRELDAQAARAREEEMARAKAEQARIDAEREKMAAQQAAIDAERRDLQSAKEKADREEFERQAKARAEQEARERIEAERTAAEKARVEAAEREAAYQARLEEIRPDVDRVRAFIVQLRGLRCDVKSHEMSLITRAALREISMTAAGLESALGELQKSEAAAE